MIRTLTIHRIGVVLTVLATAAVVCGIAGVTAHRVAARIRPAPPATAPAGDAIPADRVVGYVLGRPVTAGQIGLTATVDTGVVFDARDAARWTLMSRVQQAFGTPLGDRFVADEKIEVTPAEEQAFETLRAETRRRSVEQLRQRADAAEAALAQLGPDDPKRAALTKELAGHRTVLRALADAATGPATSPTTGPTTSRFTRQFLIGPKVEKALYRRYGGRVIFQQLGNEAVDARRQLYEAAERNGDVRFEDRGVRHLFYYYANMRHVALSRKAIDAWLATP